MKILQLSVFLHNIFDISLGSLGGLGYFYLTVVVALAVSLLMIVHSRAYFVLSLEHLHLSIVTPDHSFNSRLLLDSGEYTLMEIVNIKSVLAQEVSDIVLESLLVLVLLSLFHRLDSGHGEGSHGHLGHHELRFELNLVKHEEGLAGHSQQF